ncbi:MAG TPA: excinuclease ABC subunit C, partial [Armatimonadetes bacterium]|nr:excinuclease ABC subunit C [Armatimonadota bacterium]
TAVFEFIKQYYRDAVHIPKEILVSHEPSEKGILEDWLIERCGFRVSITMPKRGFKRSLVAMARENAKETVERESLRRAENAQEAAADLEELKKVLGMPDLPMRIETYDISNTQGRESVGSMVVFQKGVPARGEYRRFKIKTVEGADDFASMKEVIKRRLAAAASGDKKF